MTYRNAGDQQNLDELSGGATLRPPPASDPPRAYESSVDGMRVLFRLIRPDDKEELLEGFRRLSDRSRYERFFTHLKALSTEQLRYLTEVDHQNHSAWVVLAYGPGHDGGNGTGIGVGRWVRLTDEPEVAEVAITVIDDFHRKGLGRTLIYLCATSAYHKGIRMFKAWVLGENTKTLRMLRQVRAAQRGWDGGVMEVTITLQELLTHPELVPLRLQPVPRSSGPSAAT